MVFGVGVLLCGSSCPTGFASGFALHRYCRCHTRKCSRVLQCSVLAFSYLKKKKYAQKHTHACTHTHTHKTNIRLCLLTLWFNYCLKTAELAVNWFNYPICLFQAWFQQNCSSSGRKWQARTQRRRQPATTTAAWTCPPPASPPPRRRRPP